MVKVFFFLTISAILFSCKESSKESKDSTTTGNSENKEVNVVTENPESEEYSFLSDYPYKALPLIDSTNFNNVNSTKDLTAQQKDFLHLDTILGENYSDILQSPQISYRINLSENFSTVVITYELGEHELFSTLINYDTNFKPIAWKDIAYDEIAEGLIRKQSKIYKDSIVISQISYFDEVPDTTFTRFKLDKNGSIVNYE